jgi:hypothetical protein
VLGVVFLGELGRDGAQLGRHQGEPLALEAGDDLADEAPLDGVGLAHDEGAIFHEPRLVPWPGQPGQTLTAPLVSGQPSRPSRRQAVRASPTV